MRPGKENEFRLLVKSPMGLTVPWFGHNGQVGPFVDESE